MVVYGVWWNFVCLWMHLKEGTQDPQRRASSSNRKTGSLHFASSNNRKEYLRQRSWIPQPCCPCFPLEPALKIALGTLLVLSEALGDIIRDRSGHFHFNFEPYSIYGDDGSFTELAKLQHITIYTVFVLSGIIDILSLFTKLPSRTSLMFLSIAFLAQAMLLNFHTIGTDDISVLLHWLLTVTAYTSTFLSLLRLISTTNFSINIGFACSIMLQGTWLIQIAYILYPPSGKRWIKVGNASATLNGSQHGQDPEGRHNPTMFVTACFVWHLICIAIFSLLLWVLLRLLSSRRCEKVKQVAKIAVYRRLGLLRRARNEELRLRADPEEQERLISELSAPEDGEELVSLTIPEINETET